MKSIYVALCWVVVMMLGLPACSDDNGEIIDPYTEEQKIWIADNQAYFQDQKEALVDGKLVYKQLVVGKDTVLYRLLGEAGKVDSLPKPNSDIKVSIKAELPVSKAVFIGDKDKNPVDLTIRPNDPSVIKGLSAVLMQVRKGEKIEAIIPYQLGYGDQDYPEYAIPLFSTLQFTFTVKDFD